VEFSVNLKDWAVNADASESVTSLDPAVERVTITDSSPVPTWSRRFVRVRVNTP
jgi:hypothetical protein